MGIGAGALAAVSIGTTVAAGAASAAGALASASAQSSAARYQSQVAQNNAVMAAGAADTSIAQGDVAAQQQYQIGSQRTGAFRAAMGASGVDVNSGSAVDAQSSIARTTALNVGAVKYNADAQAVGLRNQTANYNAQQSVDIADASNATTAGYMSAGSSLLSSASSVSSKWSSFQQSGAIGSTSSAAGVDGTTLAASGGTNPWQSSMLSGSY